MSLLIAGTICHDTIETPTSRVDRVLGGSGVFASVAAALLTQPHLIGAVGFDFSAEARTSLGDRGIDLRGVQTLPDVRTQFWHGRYLPGLHSREHIDVDLDILDRMALVVPVELRTGSHVLLAHMPPHLQLRILDQLSDSRFVLADTIDHWIRTCRSEVMQLFGRVSGVVVNDGEAELLTGERDSLHAARAISQWGPKIVIIKKGEHGAIILADNDFIALPAFPSEAVIDPTGAGDTLAGALVAALATGLPLASSVALGIVAASLTVEGPGAARLLSASREELNWRLARYRAMLVV